MRTQNHSHTHTRHTVRALRYQKNISSHEFAVAVDEVIDMAVRVRERSWAVALVVLVPAAVDVARGVVVAVPCSHARARAPAKNERNKRVMK